MSNEKVQPADQDMRNRHEQVTSQEFWRDTGRFLRDQREARQQTVTELAVAAAIDRNTVKAIERGEPGHINKFERLLAALGFSIVDVLSAVLSSAQSRPTVETVTMHSAFEQLGVVDRGLLLAFARRLVELDEATCRRERAHGGL